MVAVAGRSKGCVTCRRRKVRCDLGKPTCANCARLKFTCGGYERYPVFIRRTVDGPQRTNFLDEVKPSQTSELSSISAQNGRLVLPKQGPEPTFLSWKPAGVTMNEEMWQKFDFFNRYTTFCIADSPFKPFWQDLIPRLSRINPLILNLVLALAAVHQKWQPQLACKRLPQPNSQDAFAMAHAYEGSRSLAMSCPDPSRPLVDLASCLILIAMELFQGHYFSAYLRIQDGLQKHQRWEQELLLRSPNGFDDMISQYVSVSFAAYSGRVEEGVVATAAKEAGKDPSPHVVNGDLCIAIASGLVKPPKPRRE